MTDKRAAAMAREVTEEMIIAVTKRLQLARNRRWVDEWARIYARDVEMLLACLSEWQTQLEDMQREDRSSGDGA